MPASTMYASWSTKSPVQKAALLRPGLRQGHPLPTRLSGATPPTTTAGSRPTSRPP